MAELSTKKRNALDDYKFGVPELRMFPLTDAEHVRKAIQMFHHCPTQYKKKLADNIFNKANTYGIKIDKDSVIYDYLSEYKKSLIKQKLNECVIDEEYDALFGSLLEALRMNEADAQTKVETAINMWKARKRLVKNQTDKNALLVDIKNENQLINNYVQNGNYDLIISRATAVANKIERNIKVNSENSRVNMGAANAIRQGNSGSNVRMAGRVLAATAAGVKVGTKVGKNTNNKLKAEQEINKAKQNALQKVANNGKRNAKAVGKGAAAGLATAVVGTAVSVGGALKKRQTMADPNMGYRKYAEKYASFIQGFGEEVNNDVNIGQINGLKKVR